MTGRAGRGRVEVSDARSRRSRGVRPGDMPCSREARRGRVRNASLSEATSSSSLARAPSSRISTNVAKETFKRGATRSRAAGASRAVRGETHREIARARDARGAAEHGGASASGGGEHRVRSTAMVNERWSRQLSTETYSAISLLTRQVREKSTSR
jgi:hypothetical protein